MLNMQGGFNTIGWALYHDEIFWLRAGAFTLHVFTLKGLSHAERTVTAIGLVTQM